MGILSLIFLINTGKVLGNSTYFGPIAGTNLATTTGTVLASGTATSTIVYDSYGINGTGQTPGQKADATDSATLLIQLTATSTNTILTWRYEYSDNAQDWYADNLYVSNSASSTPVLTAVPTVYNWQFASSTSQCDTSVATGTNNRGCKIVEVKTPTRYVRAIFYLPPSSANGIVNAKFVPKKQQM